MRGVSQSLKQTVARLKRSLTVIPVSAAILSPVAANAAVLEEIVVTANKREQNLQDVGISVSAFSGDQLRALGLESTTNLEAQTPGLIIAEFGGASTITNVNIRGVAQLDFADHQESPNAVYVDGAYVSFIGGVGVSMFDLDRVEVLRGPQGTLFGRNATGGLLHIISKKPTEDFEAYVDLTVAEYDKVRVEGAVNGALSDSVRARLALSTSHSDGYIENRIGSDISEDATINARAQFEFDLNDDAQLLLNFRYSDTDDVNAGAYNPVPAAPNPANDMLVEEITPATQPLLDGFCTAFGFGAPGAGAGSCLANPAETDGNPYKGSYDTVGFFDREMTGVSATLTWDLGNFNLTSITDFQSIEKDYLEDNDSTALPLTTFGSTQDTDQFSQEIRFDGEGDDYRWQAGFYYLNIDGDAGSQVDQSVIFDINFANSFSYETETWSVFGQAEFDLSDQLTLIAGVRWTEDEKEMDHLSTCVDAFGTCAFFGLANGLRLTGDRDDEDWSGKLQLNYAPNDDWLIYAGITRGNKGGIIQAAVGYTAGTTFDSLLIEPEVLTNYEVGFKGEILDGRGRLNASVFYYDYEDYQAFNFIGVAAALFNADADISGGEIELILTPTDNLDIVAGVAYLDSNVEDVSLPSGRIADQDMPFAPELSLNGLVRYGWEMFGGEVAVQLDANWVDDRFFSSINHPIQSDEDYVVTNLRISYASGDGSWDVAAFVNNLDDEERINWAFDLSVAGGGYGIQAYSPPRWAGVNFVYRWQ